MTRKKSKDNGNSKGKDQYRGRIRCAQDDDEDDKQRRAQIPREVQSCERSRLDLAFALRDFGVVGGCLLGGGGLLRVGDLEGQDLVGLDGDGYCVVG